ncbi:hypothetical protein [Desulfolutivibrio sp.]|uniref:hypothetical protein n=1 Tax=Desulfolutivibrio sp. TaxID=2773296 RepID=UPI002F964A76
MRKTHVRHTVIPALFLALSLLSAPAALRAQTDDLALFLPAILAGSQAMVFVTEGASFSPVIVVTGNPDIRWTFADGTTSTSATPTKNYGSAARRENRLVVTPFSAVTRINIGYDAGDGGTYDIEFVPDQQVSEVRGLHLVAPSLAQWCSSYNRIPSLDFSNFRNLDTIECYLSGHLTQVGLANTPKLRRACFEDCSLTSLDLSGSPNLEDLRGAVNDYPTIAFGATGAHVWHICVRDNPQFANRGLFADMTPFPLISELFIWNDNQAGTLRIPATSPDNTVSILAWDNAYAALDLSGALQNLGATASVQLPRNSLTSINIAGCRQITELDLQDNQLSAATLDTLLATLDALGRSQDNAPEGATLRADIRGNAAPGADGYAHAENLAAKGWTVAATGWTLEPSLPDNGEQRIDFVTSGDATSMRCDFRGAATVGVWHWSDGTTSPAATAEAAAKTGLGAGLHAHHLTISNGAALLRFGAGVGGAGQLTSMTGFENCPALSILFAYQEGLLTALGRTNATRVREYHLKGTALSAATMDQLFADAVASEVFNGVMWSDNAGTAASDADRATLALRGWTLETQ